MSTANTSENKSLWPEISFEEMKTPLAVLQEQANELGKMTSNILVGEIITTEAFDENTGQIALVYQFYIKAPILSNYRYLLFRLLQKESSLYPVALYFAPDEKKFENIKENQFQEILKEIFANPKTQEVIKSLYAQSLQMRISA